MQEELPPDSGIWKNVVTEIEYSGTVYRLSRRFQPAEQVNDNLNISNEIRIVSSDPFAKQNSQWIRYVEFMGAKWKVTNVEVQYPGLIITIGGLYNAQ